MNFQDKVFLYAAIAVALLALVSLESHGSPIEPFVKRFFSRTNPSDGAQTESAESISSPSKFRWLKIFQASRVKKPEESAVHNEETNSLPITKLHQEGDQISKIELNGLQLENEGIIGKGADGYVARFKNTQSNDEMAVKVSKNKNSKHVSQLQTPFNEEAHLLRRIGLLEGKMTKTADNKAVIPMKMVKGKAYADILDYGKPESLTPDLVMKHIDAIHNAIKKQLEEKGIEHRDLHMKNIMYDESTDEATIIDFGRSGSSFVTDEDGTKINLTPYGDRIRFLQEMKAYVQKLQNRFKQYDYSNVLESIQQQENVAKMELSINRPSDEKMIKLNNRKQKEYDSLIGKIDKIKKSMPKTKEGWEKFKAITKKAKILARELQALDNYMTLRNLGLEGSPQNIIKKYRGELTGNSDSPQDLLDMNSKNFEMLQARHKDFQEAKKGLEAYADPEQNK